MRPKTAHSPVDPLSVNFTLPFNCILGSVERYPSITKYTLKRGKRKKVPQESTSVTSADSNYTLGSVERYPTITKYTLKRGKRKKVPQESTSVTSADSNYTLGSVERYPTITKYSLKRGKRKKVPCVTNAFCPHPSAKENNTTKHVTHRSFAGNNKHNGQLKSGRRLLQSIQFHQS